MLERLHAMIREKIATLEEDRYLAPDIEAARRLAVSGALDPLADGLLPSHGGSL
jgi:histidine ammonia-lyase